MIPKKIHYCWFGGGEIPEQDKKCIESWKKFCPDYEIICWDESNYDVTKNRYMREAYEAKKWGFVSDYARLDIVYEHGGVYLDTDVELVRSIDDLLNNKAFMGFEKPGQSVNPGLGFGAEKHMPLIFEIMDNLYSERCFNKNNNEYNTTPIPTINTEFLAKKGLKKNNEIQMIEGMTIYPAEYLCPIDFETNVFSPTENTYSIHHYHASWLEPEEKKILLQSQKLAAKYGKEKADRICKIIFKPYRLKMHLRTKGFIGTIQFAIKKFTK